MPPRTPGPLLRIPYTDPLPAPRIIPASASTASGAIAALVEFLRPCLPTSHRTSGATPREHAVLLTGAGISVASGLADYRGTAGTYTLNRKYRPIYYNEFCANHEARKRYWARSFLGWTNLVKAKANAGHFAVRDLGKLGVIDNVITQNVDSFHPLTHPALPTTELHGYLRTLTCLTCHTSYPRSTFQSELSRLNPAWATLLQSLIESSALDTENPAERSARGLKTNPDGDVDLPGAEYTTFRYPACPTCLAKGSVRVDVDGDGAWTAAPGGAAAGGGILKPSVVMFGESIPPERKVVTEQAIDSASRILVIGSSLATYSAWRLVKRAKENRVPIGILNIGGCRGEDAFYAGVSEGNMGREAVRVSERADVILPQVVKELEGLKR